MNGNYQAGLAVPQMHGNGDNAAETAYGANIRTLTFKPLPDSRNSANLQGVHDIELDH